MRLPRKKENPQGGNPADFGNYSANDQGSEVLSEG